MNMIKTAKKSSARSSALGYIDAVNYNNDLASMNNDYGLDYSLISDGTHQVNSITVKMKGKKPTSGTITIENKKVTEATLCIDGYKVVYSEKEAEVDGKCNSSETQSKYTEAKLNGADPELKSDMKPVTIDNDGTVKMADIYTSWYSYSNKRWANAVVLTDSTTSYEAGDTIQADNIKAYYVWIPRYRYEIFNDGTSAVSVQEINIVFENKNKSKSSSTTKGGYLTHPAFTYGSEELNGIWVGKFETTGTASSPTIKPNIQSLRSQKVADQYTSSQNISTGSIMMKNDEWGAMAYLSHSKYGTNKQIRINNRNNYTTGCGANEDNAEESSTCEIAYGQATSYPQSTTGNIYGIFDTSGGAWEYVMGVKADQTGKPYSGRHNVYNSGFNGKFGCPTCDSTTSGVDSSITELTSGTDFPDSKNYNLYNGTSYNNACNSSKCYGDATRETRSWYSDSYYFVSAAGPWVFRGGCYSGGAGAGVFCVSSNYGYAYSVYSFRSVVR